MDNIITDYLKAHINEPMNDVIQGLEETLQSRISDRRFKLRVFAASSNGSGSSWSAIVSFCGHKNYMHVLQPWAMCPGGEVTVERTR